MVCVRPVDSIFLTNVLLHTAGTYNGSYTWFEAAILRPALESQGWRRQVLAWVYHRFGVARPLFEVTNPAEPDGRSRWRLQTNRCATDDPVHRRIIWSAAGSETAIELEKNGSGDGAGFIELLSPGDRIGVVAKAMVEFNILFVLLS